MHYLVTAVSVQPHRLKNFGPSLWDGGRGECNMTPNEVNSIRSEALQCDTDAQCSLGCAYWDSDGVEQDYEEAVYWFREAAEQGWAPSQCNLGAAYMEGTGVKQDPQKAVKWFRKSAEQDWPHAQYCLGMAFKLGYTEDRGRDDPYYWLSRAAKNGDEDAIEELKK